MSSIHRSMTNQWASAESRVPLADPLLRLNPWDAEPDMEPSSEQVNLRLASADVPRLHARPHDEVNYWRDRFESLEYGRAGDFSQYEPAFRYAAEVFPVSPEADFDEIESFLERGWNASRGVSTLSWQRARAATRDAWERLSSRQMDRAAAAGLNHAILTVLHDGALGLMHAADRVRSPRFASGLRDFAAQRLAFIDAITPIVADNGAAPVAAPEVFRGWLGESMTRWSDDAAILTACERAEDSTVDAYRTWIDSPGLAPELRELLSRQFSEIRHAHNTLRDWRDSL